MLAWDFVQMICNVPPGECVSWTPLVCHKQNVAVLNPLFPFAVELYIKIDCHLSFKILSLPLNIPETAMWDDGAGNLPA